MVADGRVGDIGLGRAAGGGGGGTVPGARPRPLGVSLGPEARDREIATNSGILNRSV